MFLKKSKSKNNTYLSIVHSYKENGVTRHKTIANLGRLSQFNAKDMENICKALLESVNSELMTINPSDVSELSRVKWGCVQVYKKIWDMFDFETILNQAFKNRNIEFDVLNTIFLLILDRLISPSSKLKTYMNQHKYLGLKEVNINHVYRALDLLADQKELIEESLYKKNYSLFNMKIDVIFYDVTTFHFESQKQDTLKDFGFSKANKINEVQVVMGLLIDSEGRPIGFDLYPGNTFEGKTLEKSLDKIKNRFNINKVIIVADKGLNQKLNLKKIKEKGFDYIVSSKLKNMSKNLKEEALNLEEYQHIPLPEEDNMTLKYKIINYTNQIEEIIEGKKIKTLLEENIICTYSSKRANKDRMDRERAIEKAKDLINTPSKINNKRGAKRYVEADTTDYKLDTDKIKEDSRWDGIYGIQTSCKNLTPKDILEAYHQLWKIEECFRVMKTHLETRPVYHWSENRIIGHFVLCFIAFLLERTLEIELKKRSIPYSVEKIRESLGTLEFSVVTINDEIWLLRSKIDQLSKEILKILKIKSPQSFMPLLEFDGGTNFAFFQKNF